MTQSLRPRQACSITGIIASLNLVASGMPSCMKRDSISAASTMIKSFAASSRERSK